MWFKKKKKNIDKATAYLKADVEHASGAIEIPQEDMPVCTRLADGLHVCYLIDSGDHYDYVQQRDLDQQGRTHDELHRLAVENLVQRIQGAESEVHDYQGAFVFTMGGDFEASALIVDDLWDSAFRQFVEGDYLAALPARDLLMFCDSKSEEGISQLDQLVGRVEAEPISDHPLTNTLYVRRGGSWSPWKRDAN
jgi:uncharacterized protein YtpQ (UPF0354 family)